MAEATTETELAVSESVCSYCGGYVEEYDGMEVINWRARKSARFCDLACLTAAVNKIQVEAIQKRDRSKC